MSVQAIRSTVLKSMMRDELRYEIYLAVRAVVAAQAGRKLTKRLATAVEKALPEYTVYYDRETYAGRVMETKISIWNHGIDFNSRLVFRFGSKDCVDLEVFEDKNRCYGSAAAERINERRVWLGDEQKAYDIVAAYHVLCDAQEQFDKIIERNGCDASNYEIQKALESA